MVQLEVHIRLAPETVSSSAMNTDYAYQKNIQI
jgi:hypothetical protein